MIVNGYEVGAEANLCDADLSGADLRWCDLQGADLTGCKGLPEIEPFPLDVVLLEEFEKCGNLWKAFGCACEKHPQYKSLDEHYGWYTAYYLIDNACSLRRRVFTRLGKYKVTEEDIRLYASMVEAGLCL